MQPGQRQVRPAAMECGIIRQLAELASNRKRTGFVVAGFLAVHSALLAWSAARDSPIWDEVGHLVAGISHWECGTFDLYRVNPPLVRAVATLPVLLAQPEVDWSAYDSAVGARSERNIRYDFVAANGDRIFRVHTWARWACLPFSLLGAYVCFVWARELYGAVAGFLALVLWCFDPNVLAYGHVITPDLGAAACGAVAAYTYWRWLKDARWSTAFQAGLALGFAELTKSTWIVLFALWPAVWLGWQWSRRGRESQSTWRRQTGQIAVILGIGIYVLNLGYGFEGSFRRLADYTFVSRTLRGGTNNVAVGPPLGNRFAGSWLGEILVPLPTNYVQGLDLQKHDFEEKMWSYLRGHWKLGGWWYYYLYALGIKVPLGTWGLLGLSLVQRFRRPKRESLWRDECVLLAPLVVVLTLVSSQTGFNHHLRYVAPIFPFAFIWVSGVAQHAHAINPGWRCFGVLLLTWSVGSSLWIYPHNISYFNELVGGPLGGHAHLGGIDVDTNIDNGQDLLHLKRWLQRHPEVGPISVAFNGVYEARIAGVLGKLPPAGPCPDEPVTPTATNLGPLPGWYAISVNQIRDKDQRFAYFLRFQPVATAGYSIYIYCISREEANRVRRDFGLPALPASAP